MNKYKIVKYLCKEGPRWVYLKNGISEEYSTIITFSTYEQVKSRLNELNNLTF